MTPYASVIVPTHDRVSTLDVAVASVQAQSVREIEILLVCDGATDAVLGSARAIAAADARVRVLAFDKAPGAGSRNRDLAIRDHARSERIFYTDDDDLWLPEHVATLGPALDRLDVVDTLPVAATRCGRLALTLVNSGWPATRDHLVADRLKLMYDTHLAHRRSTYLRLGAPWTLSDGGDVVRRLFASFAADPGVSWETLPTVTAVSLHGGARAADRDIRRPEIAAWADRLIGATGADVLAQSSAVWPLYQALGALPAAEGETLHDYLGRQGLASALDAVLSRGQVDDLTAAFDLHRGADVPEASVRRVAPLLLDTVKAGSASWAYLRRALRSMPLPARRALIASIEPDSEYAGELLAIFDVYQEFWARRVAEAGEGIDRLSEAIRLARHELELIAGQVRIAQGREEEGLALLRAAADRARGTSVVAVALVRALLDAGRLDEADEAMAAVERRLVGMPAITQLRSRLDAARGLAAA